MKQKTRSTTKPKVRAQRGSPKLVGIRFESRVGPAALTGRTWNFPPARSDDHPLIIGLHGGTYTSAYFAIPGYSLLARAAALGIPAIMLDRPGYGGTTGLGKDQSTIARNAEWLDRAIATILIKSGKEKRGVVLIGHSIGGAIALSIASRKPKWPLLGVAISGVCLTPPPESAEAWASLPKIPMVEMPIQVKDQVMFGPRDTFGSEMPGLSRLADAPIPREELLDIVTSWPKVATGVLAKVTVPVHYRQGEFDRLWVTNAGEIARFSGAFINAPRVDARLFEGAGHCIDFHRLGAAFQLEQLAFAARCGVEAKSRR